jgi:hydroxymethylbilane synthase
MKKTFRLGTRGSPLALIQAQIVRDLALQKQAEYGRAIEIEIVPLRTTGDWMPAQREQTFLDMGMSKGLFTKEIEEALLEKRIDFAVHSMKDVSVWTPEGLAFAALLPREDPRDAFISSKVRCLQDLPMSACVGTSSLRRKAQLCALRPDLKVVPLRGNVDTRLKKLADREADATILAVAGLKRLGLTDRAPSFFTLDEMLPAPAQGVLGVEIRAEDEETREIVRPLHDSATEASTLAERAVLRVLDGSCRVPIAAYAEKKGQDELSLRALAARPDGSLIIREESTGAVAEAEAIGVSLGRCIKEKLPSDFFAPFSGQ